MKVRLVVAFFVVFLGAGLILAQGEKVEILSHKESVFVNTDCKKNKTCDLKMVEYFVEDYRVNLVGGQNYGTRFFVRYKTKLVKNLKKYVFVQFIKGCVFSSKLLDNQVVTRYDFVYPRDSGSVAFKFMDWTIDSYDQDPAYATIPGKSRFFGYRWNSVAGSFSKDTEKLYGQTRPKTPELYLVDHPGSSFWVDGSAKNISLQFKTCIYKAKEVSVNVAHDDMGFAKPLHCYEWNSSFVYNHLIEKFENPPYIISACQ